jgi:hypothetical protein
MSSPPWPTRDNTQRRRSLLLLDHDTGRRLGRASPFLQDFACSFENIYLERRANYSITRSW